MDRTLKSVNFFNGSIENDETCIYEVFRIENGKPLFLQAHLERFDNSLAISGKEINFNTKQISNRLKLLFSANDIQNGNVKLDYRIKNDGEAIFMAYFIPVKYPGELEKREGIRCSLQFSERHHPQAKIYNPDVRGKANSIIEQGQTYETILVNSNNCLTEGSRSNLFFIKDNTLFTADDSLVLPGIMRKQMLLIADKLKIQVVFRAVMLEEMETMEAAFITGTSPRLLPIKQLDKVTFKVEHPILLQMIKEVEELILAQI
ncbi:aminotransferase class IV [Carboxylicivirga marina]|uniref:branched-chain-amino-acid transaminase n=1 Tax=Carboxylicivirga marina TaxID=2800988 RepID=A0ABS1HJZ3_9BACT|nr:aminotransferase class IV [Carboxylicivirga marina]MBK3517785.1 aminotransferase class IV [Carboxylicivirga marina]